MGWNEPGGGNRDPWGGGGRDQGPPDLDELLRRLQARLQRLFGRSGRDGGSGGGGGAGFLGIGLIAGALLVIWLLSGFYIVTEGQRGIVLRFGEYNRTTMPGLAWHMPYPLEEVRTVDVDSRRIVRVGYGVGAGTRSQAIPSEGLMLTQDENIVNVQLAVQWQVSDPSKFLFTLLEPELTLKQLTEAGLREVVGKRTMDFVLTEGRAEVEQATYELVQGSLDQYGSGMRVVELAIQDVQPPEDVQQAFADVTRAREDEQRAINEARAYRNEVLPRAAGEGARALEEAEGYRSRVIAQAQGEASRFLALLAEYQQAPAVTRERLYLETIESVLSASSKALIDVEGGQPLMYLPLDKMMERSQSASGSASGARAGGAPAAGQPGASGAGSSSSRDRLRSREVR